ncbi:Uncharacterised protein [Citrobacter koseri]|uniref:Uncharacterized protein n=1 Tax=Citrobacter koseri TaxID=545 RepID=A0A447UH77_CITKO|nr:Uncharacterised protein [Citrobacter koseri]
MKLIALFFCFIFSFALMLITLLLMAPALFIQEMKKK